MDKIQLLLKTIKMDKMQSYITDFGDLYVEKNNKKVVITKSTLKKICFS